MLPMLFWEIKVTKQFRVVSAGKVYVDRVKAVFFDVGSTLIFPSPSVGEMFKIVAAERGHCVDHDLVDRSMPEVDALYDREYEHNGDFWCSHESSVQIWKDMYTLLSELVGLAHDSEGISEAMYDRYLCAESWSLYEDVLPALCALKDAGYRLGIISNWDASLPQLLSGLGLADMFDVIVPSAARGCRKPHPSIFELALGEMRVDASEALHVGDLPEADGAAASVGIEPVIIDRHGVHSECGFRMVSSLEDLVPLLLL